MSFPRIQFLGTGTAFHTDGRGSQAIWVAAEAASPFLVDAGPTVMSAIARYGVDYDRLDRLLVTHLHGDHTAGWPFLLLGLALEARRSRPFELIGPAGLRETLEGLTRLCYGELLASERLPFAIRYRELEVREAKGLDAGDGIRFDVLPMEHHPSSIGYRFEGDAWSLGVTGDTAWCPNLERLARESELLIAECTTVGREPPPHLSLAEIREKRARLGNGRLLLTHLTDEVAADLAQDPIPGVAAAHDGMLYPPSRDA